MMRKSGTKQTHTTRREDRAVDDHEDRRERDLRDVDHEHQAAELDEHRDRVDVGRDPRDERAAPLGVLRQHRQVVDVAERLEPQRCQPALRGAEEPYVDEVGREGRDDDPDERERDVAHDDLDVRAACREDALVGDALDDEGHEDPPTVARTASSTVTPMPLLSSGDSWTPRRSVPHVVRSRPDAMPWCSTGGADRMLIAPRSSAASTARPLGGLAGVCGDEPFVARAPSEQLGMRAVVDDAALLEVDDLVGEQDRRHPVGDDEHGGARSWPRGAGERIACSTLGIHGDVASSRISSCGLRITARAKAIRCRWPRRGWRLARPRGCRGLWQPLDEGRPLGHLEGAPDRARRRGRRRG